MGVNDVLIPPCAPRYRPLDPPELDVDLLSFVLPPAMDIDAGYQFERPPIDSKPILQLATFESAWSEDNANGEFLPEAKIGSMLFQVMMALIPENATPVNKAKDGGGRLPKEVRPRAPRLKPSPLPFTLEEVPEMSLPLAEDTDTDVYAELEQLKPMISFQENQHMQGDQAFWGGFTTRKLLRRALRWRRSSPWMRRNVRGHRHVPLA
ncbi:unnamed protein product [Effrenium voratum]|nr:unnamed protein product [Effrenium voratum]